MTSDGGNGAGIDDGRSARGWHAPLSHAVPSGRPRPHGVFEPTPFEFIE